MSDLNGRILECVQSSGLNDYDQRSALGIARTWVEKQKPVRRSVIDGYEKRDNLAEALVAIMEEEAAEPKDCVKALRKAREVINRPFRNPTMLGARAKIDKPKGGGN